ncbi:MAG: glycosyltransferase [Cyanobacteria bacterium REEB459]|nr:glycosyltransferase [Cyanobacteria bacterium REEB459]
MYKLLLVTEQSFYPDSSGGSEISTAYLLGELWKRNWQIEVISTSSLKSPSLRRNLWKSLENLRLFPPTFRDLEQGYTIWRVLSKFIDTKGLIRLIDKKLGTYRPDIVLGFVDIRCPLLSYALNQGYSCFYIARVAEVIGKAECLPNGLNIIANSPFMKTFLHSLTGDQYGVVLPFVEPDRYRVRSRVRKYVTFINPVPQKGVETVIEIARKMPGIEFLFVKGNWFHYRGNQDFFIQAARSLPNINIWENQEDIRSVYEVTDILLVPSIFQETFGRVILEAHINGIPVVAARTGGIDYTLGLGGILLDPSLPTDAYVDAIKNLKSDAELYATLSNLAFENSQRIEFMPEFQVNNFIDIISNYIKTYG